MTPKLMSRFAVHSDVGVGLVASSFALGRFCTTSLWPMLGPEQPLTFWTHMGLREDDMIFGRMTSPTLAGWFKHVKTCLKPFGCFAINGT